MKRLVLRSVVALCVAVVAAIVAAVAIAVVDLYLVGHGHAGIRKEIVVWAVAGVHLSAGDVILIGVVLLAAASGWALSGRKR